MICKDSLFANKGGNREVQKLSEKWREMGPRAILLVVAIVLALALIVGVVYIHVTESRKAEEIRKNNERIQAENSIRLQLEKKRLDEIFQATKEEIELLMPGFICLGDDLTAGNGGGATDYEIVLRDAIKKEILNLFDLETVVAPEFRNMVHSLENRYMLPTPSFANWGVSGQSTLATVAIDGGYKIILSQDLLQPAEIDNGDLPWMYFEAVRENDNEETAFYPLLGKDFTTMQVIIDIGEGINGTLNRRLVNDPTAPAAYWFVPDEPLEEDLLIPAGTEIITRQSMNNRDYFPIILMGMNDGYETVEELIDQHRALLADKELYAEGYYLVIGLIDSTPAEEAKFREAFGDNYLNAREYLVEHGLEAAGIEPTEKDAAAIARGEVPPSLLNPTGRFLKSTGYTVLGQEVFRRIDALGYFDAVREVIADAMTEAQAYVPD